MEQKNEGNSATVFTSLDTATIRRLFDEKIKELTLKTNPEQTLAERLAELEFKVGRLWGLLTEKTPTGQTRLTKTGRTWRDILKEKSN